MRRWIPVALYAGLIFYISSLPYIGVPKQIVVLDPETFTLHLLEYIPLGFLIARALRTPNPFRSLGTPVIPTIIGGFYGVSDEFHQLFVPGRTASIHDVAADFMGVILGVFLWSWIQGRAKGDETAKEL